MACNAVVPPEDKTPFLIFFRVVCADKRHDAGEWYHAVGKAPLLTTNAHQPATSMELAGVCLGGYHLGGPLLF